MRAARLPVLLLVGCLWVLTVGGAHAQDEPPLPDPTPPGDTGTPPADGGGPDPGTGTPDPGTGSPPAGDGTGDPGTPPADGGGSDPGTGTPDPGTGSPPAGDGTGDPGLPPADGSGLDPGSAGTGTDSTATGGTEPGAGTETAPVLPDTSLAGGEPGFPDSTFGGAGDSALVFPDTSLASGELGLPDSTFGGAGDSVLVFPDSTLAGGELGFPDSTFGGADDSTAFLPDTATAFPEETSGFIVGDEVPEAAYFDPTQTTFGEWAGGDEAIDWNADGSVDQNDYDLLEWMTADQAADANNDGFLDETDFDLSQWLQGSQDADANGDGAVDEKDFTLFQQSTQGLFANQAFYLLAEAGHDRAVVSWMCTEPGLNDTLRYRPAGQTSWQTLTRYQPAAAVFDHWMQLAGLQPDTEYEVEVRSVSLDGFATDLQQAGFRTRIAPDVRPAAIADLDVQPAAASVTLRWFTSRPADARYAVRLAADGQVVAEGVADEEGQTAHAVFVGDLEPDTPYTFTVSSAPTDLEELVAGGWAAADDLVAGRSGPFRTGRVAEPLRLLLPPFSAVAQRSAVVEVQLSQIAQVVVDYGRADNFREKVTAGTQAVLYNEKVASAQQLGYHSITLGGLKPRTAYRYRITAVSPGRDTLSTDPFGDQPWSYDWQFTTLAAEDTLPPVVVEGPQVIARDKVAVVEWTTDVETTGKVAIGTQAATYGTPDEFTFVDMAPGGVPALAQRHVVTLTALDPGTAYAYRIESTAANGATSVFSPAGLGGAGKAARIAQPPGGAGSFITSNQADTQFPVILTGPTVTSRSNSTAVVEWITDEPANSVVRFGREQLDGQVSLGDNDLEHRMVLSNLSAGTSYKFMANSTDAVGNGATQSAQAVFTTDPEFDLRAPQLVGTPEITYKNDRSASIRWTTDEVATGEVEYGTSTNLGTVRRLPQTDRVHEAALTNLRPATTYHYRVASLDLANNGPTRSEVLTFTTDAQADLTPPVISDVTAIPADSSVIVRWTTDEPGDSFVEYGTDQGLGEKTGEPRDVVAHEIVLTNLRPATTYYFRTGSMDRANNPPAVSPAQSFATLAHADTVPPAAPAGLQAQAGAGQAVLSWTATTAPDLAGYNLYRRTGGGNFLPVATRLADTRYTDLGLANGSTYEYRLTAVDRARLPNESPPSAAVAVQPAAAAAPSAPTQLSQGGDLFTPTLSFTNATPYLRSASLTYMIQVSSDSTFSDVVASASAVAEGTGTPGPGRTAWPVDRRLAENQTYYWRVRAVEGDLLGPFSAARQFRTQRPPELLAGDFNGDRAVNFTDFFLFADNFGKRAAGAAVGFDLSGNGTVDFADFFLFADNFGRRATGKPWAVVLQTEGRMSLRLRAVAGPGMRTAVLQVGAAGMEQIQGIGLVLTYDPRLAEPRLTRPGQALARAPLFRVLRDEPGRLVLGASVADGPLLNGDGALAELEFGVAGPADQLVFEVEEALLSRPGGQIRRLDRPGRIRLQPATCFLEPGFPNPFNPATTIRYGLAGPGRVVLVVRNVLGQKVKVLVQEEQPAGFHAAVWDGTDQEGRPAASGLYLVQLLAPGFGQVRKVALLR